MNAAPLPPLALVRGGSGKLDPASVEPEPRSVLVGDPGELRHVVRQSAKSRFAVTQRHRYGFAGGDVLDEGNEVVRCSGAGSRQRDSKINPDQSSVFADVTLLHRVGLNGPGKHLCDISEVGGQVVGMRDVL